MGELSQLVAHLSSKQAERQLGTACLRAAKQCPGIRSLAETLTDGIEGLGPRGALLLLAAIGIALSEKESAQ